MAAAALRRAWRERHAALLEPSYTPLVAACLCLAEGGVNLWVIRRVPYTEIDWKAYMDEVEGFANGTLDYTQLKGDTGPLVYPAGFVYIFLGLYYATGRGTDIRLAQYLFAGLYLLNLLLVFRIYCRTNKPSRVSEDERPALRSRTSIPPPQTFRSPGLHPQALHLCPAPGNSGAALPAGEPRGVPHPLLRPGSPVPVQMDGELALPPRRGFPTSRFPYHTAPGSPGWPGALCPPSVAQVQREHPGSAKGSCRKKTPIPSLDRQQYPSAGWGESRAGQGRPWAQHPGAPSPVETQPDPGLSSTPEWAAQGCPTNLVWGAVLQGWGVVAGFTPPALWVCRLNACAQIVFILFSSNFLGVCCSRSLHYQFYVWYFHTLPYLLWCTPTAKLAHMPKVLLLGVIELCWNTYPSTVCSSLSLHICHGLVLLQLWYGTAPLPAPHNPQPGRRPAPLSKKAQ
ncbi:dol-P-Man:Man(5)GlcNAc(2)-PP-Dol alpha-1,3-mannosyltransferase isoform X2 [Struthio camelus]|uniref:dol-P-Man:Man(5)GlcNAc(2)-PP-Dol alpha-1,3-mannosyltransferase isoform X2 n=1 Tax=Struthio camelus TaxID=8801 RepID=UPI0036042E15